MAAASWSNLMPCNKSKKRKGGGTRRRPPE
ncbi:hypothetical protein TPMD04_20 [Thiohalocapsa phage LS06-2018-MD04]|nr:hypothetical protein TPMD04_20 [Thiohalocapsa phage LS06-2018-MD04]